MEVRPLPGLSFAAWEEELRNDPVRQFILSGIKHGFDIIDADSEITPVDCENHPTARPGSPLYEEATRQVIKAIESGNYVICSEAPNIVSPMAAIPKLDGGVRLIHDCSWPVGTAVNDYCFTDWKKIFSRG